MNNTITAQEAINSLGKISKARFLAMDEDGEWWAHVYKPILKNDYWNLGGKGIGRIDCFFQYPTRRKLEGVACRIPAMTNEELLKMLDGDLGERAIKNCIQCWGEKIAYSFLDRAALIGGISVVLNNAFDWSSSVEGEDFWSKIYDELRQIGL